MIATLHTPETHAYHIPHVDVMNTQARKSIVVVDYAFVRNNAVVDTGSISAIDRKRLNNTNFGSSYGLLHYADDSTEISSDTETYQARQIIRDRIHLENQTAQRIENHAVITNDDGSNDDAASVQILSNVDHEEIRTIEELDRSCKHIRDYYEDYEVYSHYSPNTAMSLMNTLPFPHHSEICEEYVRSRCSPVYTDRLIYARESLLAVEVVSCQRDDVACFKYLREESNDILHSQYHRDCMLVYNYVKTNAAGIFYSYWPQDIFDLKTLLKPSIRVIGRVAHDVAANAHLYHRCVNNYYMRVSRAGCASMTFYRDRGTTMNCIKYTSYNNDDPLDLLSYAPIHQSKNEDNIKEHRRDRSSLLLLEPLLLMPELTSSAHKKNMKNRILRSERVKIVRIIIAYLLSFLILASITFYIVYFT